MQTLRIDTEGLTLREVYELEAVLKAIDGVEDAKFMPFLPGVIQQRSLPPVQMALGTMHLMFRLAETAAVGTALEAGRHLYKNAGAAITDKVWEAVSAKLTGNSVVEVGVKLYGPDGQLIEERKGKR